jgi:hypothetical protein
MLLNSRCFILAFILALAGVDAFVHVEQNLAAYALISKAAVSTRPTNQQVVLPPRATKSTQRKQSSGHRSFSVALSMWRRDGELEGMDRFKACVPYLLPLLDGDVFGKFIYQNIPPLGFLDGIFIGPLSENFVNIPFLGLLFFVALTLGTRGNTNMSFGVRFNAQQAALIDAALLVPQLISISFEGEDMPRYLVEPLCGFVWYTYMSMVLYSIYCNLQGKKPDQIPYISGLSEMLVGPL